MMNIIEKLGIEKCKQIVSDPLALQMTHVSNDGRHWVNEEFSYIPEIQVQIQKMIRISDLRTEIANHERTDNCADIKNHISPNTKVIER